MNLARPDSRAGNGPVSLLARSIPNLSLNGLSIRLLRAIFRPRDAPGHGESYLNGTSSELHTNCGLRLEIKLIAGKPRKQVTLSDSRVSDQDDYEREEQVEKRVNDKSFALLQ